MNRKPEPSKKSANRSIALFGIVVFMGVGLMALPLIVGVVLVVAYLPGAVAIGVPIAYLTRRRWTPWLKRKTDRYFASPELDRMQARAGRRRGPSTPVQVLAKSDRTKPPDQGDLRDAGRP
jgi:hypothetical protein